MSWSSYHTESERLAIAAELSARNSDATRASELYRLAAESEARALAEVRPDQQRTLGITVVSAVALYYKGGAYETARNLAQQWLGKSSLPTFAIHQLKEIFSDQITQQLYEDYELARKQAKAQYFLSLTVSVASTLTILVGVCLLLLGNSRIGIVCATSGLVGAGIGQLLFTRLDNSRHRVDRYHEEMLQMKRLDSLVTVCEQIDDEETRQTYIARLIQANIQASKKAS
jgi:hypothetical protein